MTRWLVLGATGTVGRALTATLAERPDTSVVALSRNRVLLEELKRRRGCEIVELDVASSSATVEELPSADVVVDLTYAGGRHPRAIVRRSERAASLISSYLERHQASRLVHTGTFVLLDRRPDDARRLITQLDWSSTYTLSKSAAERALARRWRAGRMRVVRLANVVTPDSAWGVALLRALRAGAIANPEALAAPANVCGIHEVVRAIDARDGPAVALACSAAGWTWSELLAATARAVDRGDGSVCGDWEALPVQPERGLRPGTGGRASLGLRVLWPLPLRLDTLGLDLIPGWAALAPALKRVLGVPQAAPTSWLPPALPAPEAMPGAGRDSDELESIADALAAAYMERGYFPWSRKRATSRLAGS